MRSKILVFVAFLLILVGCNQPEEQASKFMIINNLETETSQLFTFDDSLNEFIFKKEFDSYFSQVVKYSNNSIVALDKNNKLVTYNLKDNSREELLDISEVIDMGSHYISRHRLSPTDRELFFEKISKEFNGIYKVSSYNLDTQEEIQWTHDDSYSYFSPNGADKGVYVLRNKSGTYKESPKDLYFIECPTFTPTKVNSEELDAYSLLDIDFENQKAYLVTEQSGGMTDLVVVSLDTGLSTKIIENESISSVSSKDGIFISTEGFNKYSLRSLESLEEILFMEFEKDISVKFISFPYHK